MKSPNTTQATQKSKTPSTKPSLTGGILAIIALIFAGLGNLLAHARYKPEIESVSASEKAGEAVANGTTVVLGTIFGVPFIIGALLFGALAILFTLLRLKNVKVGGWVLSILWIGLSLWAISIAVNAFDLIKAH